MSTHNESKIALLQKVLGDRLLTEEHQYLPYVCDWSHVKTATPLAIAFPQSIEEVAKIVCIAKQYHIPLVPSGGRTGLSGGAAIISDGALLVAFDRMNRILEFHASDRIVRLEPGVITHDLQKFAADKGLFYPVDFASSGSSQIGGNISTNAGGIKVIRYGLTRDHIVGLKVITGEGTLLDVNKGLVKNATGYDLRHLFIGAEGTLGMIVEATVKLTKPPCDLNVLVLGVPKIQDMMQILSAFEQQVTLTAFECFSDNAMRYVTQHGVVAPLAEPAAYYCLIELETASQMSIDNAMRAFETCLEEGWVSDGVMSQSSEQQQQLWQLRERISEAIAPYRPYKHDISVMIHRVPELVTAVDALVKDAYPHFEIVWFGHIGDGNLHLNILKPEHWSQADFVAQCQTVSYQLFEIIQRLDGAISAEHGVGVTKKAYLEYSRSEAEIDYMRSLKQVFDPHNIMNPGKIFD